MSILKKNISQCNERVLSHGELIMTLFRAALLSAVTLECINYIEVLH